jgi:hypothetical protein
MQRASQCISLLVWDRSLGRVFSGGDGGRLGLGDCNAVTEATKFPASRAAQTHGGPGGRGTPAAEPGKYCCMLSTMLHNNLRPFHHSGQGRRGCFNWQGLVGFGAGHGGTAQPQPPAVGPMAHRQREWPQHVPSLDAWTPGCWAPGILDAREPGRCEPREPLVEPDDHRARRWEDEKNSKSIQTGGLTRPRGWSLHAAHE